MIENEEIKYNSGDEVKINLAYRKQHQYYDLTKLVKLKIDHFYDDTVYVIILEGFAPNRKGYRTLEKDQGIYLTRKHILPFDHKEFKQDEDILYNIW
jgi:hypothetical protein